MDVARSGRLRWRMFSQGEGYGLRSIVVAAWALQWGCDADTLVFVPDGGQAAVDTGQRDLSGPPDDGSPDSGPPNTGSRECVGLSLFRALGLENDVTHFVLNETSVIPLGMGYRTGSGQATQVCVDGDETKEESPRLGFDFDSRSSSRVREESVGVEVGASAVIGGFGAQSRLEYAVERAASSNDINIVLRSKIQTHTDALTSMIRLADDDSVDLEELASTDPFRLEEICGDRWVVRRVFGGALTVYFRVSTTSETDKERLRAELSASFGAGGFEGSVQSALQKTLSTRETTIQIERIGGRPRSLPPNFTPEALIQYISAFPTDVDENSAVLVEFVTRPFSRLPQRFCPPNYSEQAVEAIQAGWERLNETLDALAEHREALSHPEFFACVVPRSDREMVIGALEDYEARLKRAISRCARGVGREGSSPAEIDCHELAALAAQSTLADIVPPVQVSFIDRPFEAPMRWQYLLEADVIFEGGTGVTSRAWRLPAQTCGRIWDGFPNRWSAWRSDDPGVCPEDQRRTGTCWERCPSLARFRDKLDFAIWDIYPGDNRGRCEYTIGCVDEISRVEHCDDI